MKLQIVSTLAGWAPLSTGKLLGGLPFAGGPFFTAPDRYQLAHEAPRKHCSSQKDLESATMPAAPVQWASRHFLTHEVSTKGVKHENTSAQRCRAVA